MVTNHSELKPYKAETVGTQSGHNSVLSYFDTSAKFAGVQYEYN